MVSTRSVKHKFLEGEKVLCYEPDPQKTKVLYNSKVLGVAVKQDENGRKVVQFLIHFQGWNSTWDRFVTEDYILKDTEENRKLQKELAEKAQLTAGGNLYRRGRKKRTLSRTGSDNDRRGGDSDSDGDVSGAFTYISDGLQQILEFDYEQITKANKLHRLPCSPNALEILELWMKDYTINQIRLMCHKRGNLRPTAGKNAHITVSEIQTRANLCREVADGIRIYLDFMLGPQLLYRPEKAQHKEVSMSPLPQLLKNMKKHNADGHKEELDAKHNLPAPDTDRRKSLRSHTDTTNPNAPNSSTPQGNAQTPLSTSSHQQANTAASNNATPQSAVKLLTPVVSNKLDQSQTSVDLASVLGQDVVKGGEHLMLRPMSSKEKELLKKLVHRKLAPDDFRQPDEGSPLSASLIYGAMHLCRALVKIPEIYSPPNLPEPKMSVITEYLTLFFQIS